MNDTNDKWDSCHFPFKHFRICVVILCWLSLYTQRNSCEKGWMQKLQTRYFYFFYLIDLLANYILLPGNQTPECYWRCNIIASAQYIVQEVDSNTEFPFLKWSACKRIPHKIGGIFPEIYWRSTHIACSINFS